MDEWVVDGKEVDIDFPLSFAKADMELCFNCIRPDLRMPPENIHFPAADPTAYIKSWSKAKCLVMQGGQGEVNIQVYSLFIKSYFRPKHFTE